MRGKKTTSLEELKEGNFGRHELNGENSYYAWGLNHPRTEKDAIVIYTEEYGKAISSIGSKAVMVENGVAKYIVENKDNLWVSQNGFIIFEIERIYTCPVLDHVAQPG